MFQAVLDIHLQTSNGASKNWVMTTTPITDLDTLEKQVDITIKNCKRSYNNLPVCHVTIIVFDIANKIITHYKDINIKQYAYNEPIMTTAKLTNNTATKEDYNTLFSMYQYALIDMQKNNERR